MSRDHEPTLRGDVLISSFSSGTVILPELLKERLPILALLIAELGKSPFKSMVGNGLPEATEALLDVAVDIPEIPEDEEYSQVRSVADTLYPEDRLTGVKAAAINFRNDDLRERTFAAIHDPVFDKRTVMRRVVDSVRFYADGRSENSIRSYNEAMEILGPLALTGFNELPEELQNKARVLAPLRTTSGNGDHEGGLSYRNGSWDPDVTYTHLESFETPDGGFGRNFRVALTDWSCAHVLRGEMTGSTVLYLDPPVAPLQP